MLKPGQSDRISGAIVDQFKEAMSATLAGIAGALYASYNAVISPA